MARRASLESLVLLASHYVILSSSVFRGRIVQGIEHLLLISSAHLASASLSNADLSPSLGPRPGASHGILSGFTMVPALAAALVQDHPSEAGASGIFSDELVGLLFTSAFLSVISLAVISRITAKRLGGLCIILATIGLWLTTQERRLLPLLVNLSKPLPWTWLNRTLAYLVSPVVHKDESRHVIISALAPVVLTLGFLAFAPGCLTLGEVTALAQATLALVKTVRPAATDWVRRDPLTGLMRGVRRAPSDPSFPLELLSLAAFACAVAAELSLAARALLRPRSLRLVYPLVWLGVTLFVLMAVWGSAGAVLAYTHASLDRTTLLKFWVALFVPSLGLMGAGSKLVGAIRWQQQGRGNNNNGAGAGRQPQAPAAPVGPRESISAAARGAERRESGTGAAGPSVPYQRRASTSLHGAGPSSPHPQRRWAQGGARGPSDAGGPEPPAAPPADPAQERRYQVSKIILRKGFHVLGVLLMLPGLQIDPEFQAVALAIAAFALAAAEATRLLAPRALAGPIDRYMRPFTDTRDSGQILTTHFSLLLGLASPLWVTLCLGQADGHAGAAASYPKRMLGQLFMHVAGWVTSSLPTWVSGGPTGEEGPARAAGEAALEAPWLVRVSQRTQFPPLEAFSGMLTLGVMDVAASVVGCLWGRHRLAVDTNKTVEGTLAGIVSGFLASMAIQGWKDGWLAHTIVAVWTAAWGEGRAVLFRALALPSCDALIRSCLPPLVASTGAGLIEAYTDQIDNMVTPYYYMMLLAGARGLVEPLLALLGA